MKPFIIVFLFSSMLLLCCSSIRKNRVEEVQDTHTDIQKKVDNLKRAYQRVSFSPSTPKFAQEYFEAFPNTFALLNAFFGYTDKEPMGKDFNPGPLYHEAESYIEVYFNLHIERQKRYNHMIDLCINGKWYADGVNYFKHRMEDKVTSDIDVFCELLSKRSDQEISSFWHFYFDSPVQVKEIPEELHKIKEMNKRIYSLMEQALNH